IQFTEGLAVKLIERAKALRATQPRVARKILSAIEDSAAARKLILARHPGEAYILGDSNYPNNPIDNLSLIANSPDNPSGMKQWEEEMRREVKSQNGAVEIYALGRVFESKTFTGAVIRVRGSKAEISLYEDPAWRSYRQLTPVELEELKSFTARQEV